MNQAFEIAATHSQSERGEFLGCVRQHVDTEAKPLDLGRQLVDPAINSRAVQREGERQAADAAADDDHVFHLSPFNAVHVNAE